MSHLKKTLAIFLMVCMLASMMPVGTAFAADETPAAAADGAGGADPNTCDHLKDVDGAKISAFKDSTCELCGYTCTSHTWNMGGVCNTCGTECEHAWNELNDGTTYRQCSKCSTICNHMGFFDHDWLCRKCGYQCAHASTEITAEVKATCTTPGKTEGETCKDCGVTIKAQTDVPALGHDWSKKDGVCARSCGVTCTHTMTAEGGGTVSLFKNGACEVCGFTCAHASVVDEAEVKATCTTAGHEAGKKCTVCGAYTEGGKEIAATGHSWDHTDPTLAKCKNCGETCSHEKTADGTTTKLFENGKCSVCGYACTHKKADGTHNFKSGKCQTCGYACTHQNTTADTCPDCGKKIVAVVIGKDNSKTFLTSGVGTAVSNLKDGDTLKLLKKTTASLTFANNVNVTLDLNQFNLSEPYGNVIGPIVLNAGSLTVKNGTINCKYGIKVNGKSTLTIEKDVTLSTSEAGSTGILVETSAAEATVNVNGTVTGQYAGIYVRAPRANINVNGTVSGTANGIVVGAVREGEAAEAVDVTGTTVTVSGTVTGNDLALCGNGNHHGTTFNIKDGAKLTATNGVAIYHPQNGTLNIEGGTITGGLTGVEVRAGTVTISGGTITGGQEFECNPDASGSTTKGAALAVVQHTTNLPISVTIKGGTFNGKRAIHEQDTQGNDVLNKSEVQITVEGGTLNGEVFSSDDKITFSGAAKDTVMTVPTTEDAAYPNAVVADASFIHAGAENVITAGAKTEAVISKKALKECASSNDTILTVDTDEASVSLDGLALKAINDAVTDADGSATVHVKKLAETADGKKYEVYVTDTNGAEIASDGATLVGGSATVVLKDITKAPKQVRHYDLNADNSYKFMEPFGASDFTYDADKDTVTVKITHFSYLETSMNEIPVIDETSLGTLTVMQGDTVNMQLVASGNPDEWTYTGELPAGLTLDKDGKLSGTVADDAEAKDYTITVKAENAAGFDTAELTITVEQYVAARLYHEDGTEIGTGYPTVQAAVDAAKALGGTEYYSVVVENDSPKENVVVEDANVIFIGLDADMQPTKLGSITYGPGCEGGVMSIVADTVTVQKDATVYLGEGNNIKKVVNKNTIGNIDNADPRVYIDGGHYGSLSPAKGGSYLMVNGGTDNPTFDTQIPMEYCREVVTDDAGNIVVDKEGNPVIIQRCAKYNSRTKQYEIVDFKFEITAVSNSGYHMPGSQKTLVFSTNLDYTLADRDRGDCTITVTSGNGSKPISSVYYEITADKNGKAQITLKASTLNRLALGRYSLTYDGPTGKDSMYFHISNTVKTGDTSNIGLWMGIMGVSVVVLCAVAAVLVIKSKKKNGGGKAKNDKK